MGMFPTTGSTSLITYRILRFKKEWGVEYQVYKFTWKLFLKMFFNRGQVKGSLVTLGGYDEVKEKLTAAIDTAVENLLRQRGCLFPENQDDKQVDIIASEFWKLKRMEYPLFKNLWWSELKNSELRASCIDQANMLIARLDNEKG